MKKDWNARLEEITQTDKAIWATGRAFAGIDEAGRGPLCGPVAAACVVMPPEPLLLYVDDSKKLTEKRREALYDQIMETAVYAKVILASPEEIDRVNILNATKNAMALAAKDAPCDLCAGRSARAGARRRAMLFDCGGLHFGEGDAGPHHARVGRAVSAIRFGEEQGIWHGGAHCRAEAIRPGADSPPLVHRAFCRGLRGKGD